MLSLRGACPLRPVGRRRYGLLLAFSGWLTLLPGVSLGQEVVGLTGPSLRMADLTGQLHMVGEAEGTRATVLVFLSTECPIARAYIPELHRIFATWGDRRVEFYGVFSDPTLTRARCEEFVKEFDIRFPVIFDASCELASRLVPTHVPEAFVLDAQKRLTYRGRIDDIYRDLGRRQLTPSRRDLIDAVDRTLSAHENSSQINLVQTTPVGCRIERVGITNRPVTYRRDIAPLVHANCTECHRAGEVAPFSLESYEDCVKRASFLAQVVKQGLMPPWLAGTEHGDFLGNRVLTSHQRDLLQRWVDDGLLAGDSADEPAIPNFPKGWRLGEPDLVIESPFEVQVPADGDDLFQHYVIPLDMTEGKTLIGFEFQPGNSAVVHHAVVFYDTMGAARAKDAKSPEPGYTTFGSPGIPVSGVIGFWTPGMTPRFLPDRIGYPIPKKADLLLQLHLHPSGKVEKDRSRIGLYFAKNEHDREQRMSRVPLVLGTFMIDVAAGEKTHQLGSEITLPAAVTLTSVLPHMHLIGKEMKITAYPPTGETVPLLWIKNWNFYWQDSYVYREPISLPAGTRITIEGTYDNSDANPHNPSHPPRRVLFGNDSDEEMFLAAFQTVGHSPEAEKAIATALLQSFRNDWLRPVVKPDARPRIITEAIEFLGGGEVLMKMILKPGSVPLAINSG
ncbi:redoxin domain-containing protein [bacterium]|nr:redoxin domain-containing protein [bacterium]